MRVARLRSAARMAPTRSRRHDAKVHKAESDCDFDEVSALFHEYGASLDVDLHFQGFEEEIAMLPGKYAWPKGALFLAFDKGGHAIGCVGVRPFDRPAACEMKRLMCDPQGEESAQGAHLRLKPSASPAPLV